MAGGGMTNFLFVVSQRILRLQVFKSKQEIVEFLWSVSLPQLVHDGQFRLIDAFDTPIEMQHVINLIDECDDRVYIHEVGLFEEASNEQIAFVDPRKTTAGLPIDTPQEDLLKSFFRDSHVKVER